MDELVRDFRCRRTPEIRAQILRALAERKDAAPVESYSK